MEAFLQAMAVAQAHPLSTGDRNLTALKPFGEAVCKLVSDPGGFAVSRGSRTCWETIVFAVSTDNFNFSKAKIESLRVSARQAGAIVMGPYQFAEPGTRAIDYGLEQTASGWKIVTPDP